MAKWSIDRHEKKLAEDAAKHDKDVAAKTGKIFWDHKHLAG